MIFTLALQFKNDRGFVAHTISQLKTHLPSGFTIQSVPNTEEGDARIVVLVPDSKDLAEKAFDYIYQNLCASDGAFDLSLNGPGINQKKSYTPTDDGGFVETIIND